MELLIDSTLNDFFEQDLGGDKTVFNSLFEILENHSNQLSHLSPKAENLKELEKLAHKIKSGATSFGAKKVATQLKVLELEAANKNIDDCIKLHEQINKDFIDTLLLIRSWKTQKGL